jgi:hypothetical protein
MVRGLEMRDILERNKEGKKLNGHFSSIPWPNDKYLRRIRNKRYQTISEVDDKSSKERMHAGAGKKFEFALLY